MKKIKSLLAIALILLFTTQTLAVNFEQQDKQKHLIATTGISTLTYAVARKQKVSKFKSFLVAVGVSMAVGYAKELSDPFIDHKDLEADLIGAGLGPLAMVSFEF